MKGRGAAAQDSLNAAHRLCVYRAAGHNLRFFINLAEDAFGNSSIILHICDCLRELGVHGTWLASQFQEELVAENPASLGKLIDALKQIRLRVAINRFGATNRSEMILQALPVDFVVLMPDFARALAEDPVKQQRLMPVANLARQFNVKSAVTGVEAREPSPFSGRRGSIMFRAISCSVRRRRSTFSPKLRPTRDAMFARLGRLRSDRQPLDSLETEQLALDAV